MPKKYAEYSLKVILRDPKAAGRLLPWAHHVVSNIKAVIRGVHRGVSDKHLQSYLSEICYRFNRRYREKELFDRLIQANVSAEKLTYKELVHKNDRCQNIRSEVDRQIDNYPKDGPGSLINRCKVQGLQFALGGSCF